MAVPEAQIERTDAGAVVTSEGWFVLNMADAVWMSNERGGAWTELEPRDGRFDSYGIGIHVLQPGQPNGCYHSESMQEDFLVLSGESILLVEEEERRLKAWDFVHCAPGTNHIFVGAGDGPCAILMVGARGEDKTLHYPLSEIAATYGAAAAEETNSPRDAYRGWPEEDTPLREVWPPS